MDAARRAPAGARSARYRNFGLARMAGSASRMPASKSPTRPGRAVERERRRQVLFRDRPPIRAARQRRQDRRGARQLLGRVRRLAHEDALAGSACRSTPGRVERPDISRLPTRGMRSSPPPGLNECSTSSDSANVRATNVTPILCGPAVTLSGMFWNRAVDGGHGRRLLLVDGLEILLAADRVLEDLHAVERDDDRVPVLHAAHVAGNGQAGDVQLVVAVGRKRVLDEQAAASAERQAVHAHGLIRAARGPIGRCCRARRADCRARGRAHDARGGDVLVEERRRHGQHAGHVVEAVGLVVLRQQCALASMRTPSRSSMASAYSARFRRCSATRPGFGLAAAA